MHSGQSRIDRLLSRLRGGSAVRSDPSMFPSPPRTTAESVMDMTSTVMSSTRASSSVNMVNRMGLSTSAPTLALSSVSRTGFPATEGSALDVTAPAEPMQHPGGRGVSPFVTADPLGSSDEEVALHSVATTGATLSCVQEQGIAAFASGTLTHEVSLRSVRASSSSPVSSLHSLPTLFGAPGSNSMQQLARVVRESIALDEHDIAAARDMAQLFVVQREDLQPM